MLLGVHVSTAGKIYEAFERAYELNCSTMQIFSRSPQQWRKCSLEPQDIEKFREYKQKFKIQPVFIHIPYLINLASPDIRLYKASIKAYIEDIKEAASMDADFIVTHMGSHKETSEKAGLERLSLALNTILDKTAGNSVGVLLENTSGSGSWLGYRFWHQREVLSKINDKHRIGFCLDTAHAYLAGYDIAAKEGLQALLDEIEAEVGLDRIKLIHLNDAAGELGCKYDRHAHIGKGRIGIEGMKRIINHPRLKNLPFILETPKDSINSDKINLKTVKKLRQ